MGTATATPTPTATGTGMATATGTATSPRRPVSRRPRAPRGAARTATPVFRGPVTGGPAVALATRPLPDHPDAPTRAHARASASKAPPPADRSPIVRTLERIVEVIPLAV